MARTLLQILLDAQAFLDLDATTIPTGSDLTTRSNYANRAIREAASYTQFHEFDVVSYTYTSTLASISLPSDFREFSKAPYINLGGGGADTYEQINPNDVINKDLSDKYCYVLGNPGTGYTAVFNNLTVNATLTLNYQRFPSGMATLTDVCELPDDTYVVRKIEAYVLESRRDERFPIIDADANRILKNMGGRGDKTPGGGVNTTPRISRSGME